MPRDPVDIDFAIERLSIIDEENTVDEELLPDLEAGQLLSMYRAMLLGRRFDERLLELQRQGRTGTFAPIKGQEAAQIGAAATLENDDWFVPSFRETAVALWRGTPMSKIILYNAGYNEGAHVDETARDLPNTVPVASQLPTAVGLAYAASFLGTSEIILVFFGDGATSEGDFHESVNFAGVFDLPVVFLCQNNQWAISVPRTRQTKSKTLAQKAMAYGIPGIVVDGNDVMAVNSATEEAVQRARNGGGPTLIECNTYRLEVHTTADDPSRYRSEKEVEAWKKRDPLKRFRAFLDERDLLSVSDHDEMESEIESEIDAAWAEAETEMERIGDPLDMFDHVYAERPSCLESQRRSLADRLTEAEVDDHE